MDEQIRQAARELVARAIADSAAIEAQEASGWVIVCRDEETGRYTLTGPYVEPELALIDAQRQHEQVNRGLPAGEQGWTHTVVALFAPQGQPPARRLD